MKKSTYSLLLSLCFSIIYAQENVDFSGEKKIISPEIHGDNTVTFRFEAPNAKKVFLVGDFLSQLGLIEGKTEMKKNEKGIWTYTTSTLQPELYSYKFIADGLAVNDPNNVHFSRDVATVVNIFIVPGGKAELYKVNDVPHGTVSKRWYESPTLKKNRRLTVYTPPGYEKSKENYPVLYLLHGAGGDEEAWITLGRTAQILDNLIAQGKAKPMLVVMPNGNAGQSATQENPKKVFIRRTLFNRICFRETPKKLLGM
ncbi:esterase [Flavobacterium piscinae]|uniref:esterase n=1 Tax=Flavobacterium piscinae TaxID=2506424 RepID=UPI002AAA7125|nr:alpha/beta hydrolase-fold protein [Flavobacterium piscinae]